MSPHFDDAVLSAWTVLSGGDDVRVVNVCGGVPEPGFVAEWDRVTRATDSAERVRERIEEDRAVLARVGVTPDNLGFLDDQYRDEPLPAAELESELEARLDGAATLYAPAGLGSHPDHLVVREVVVGLADRLGRDVVLYADLPYATRFGWPHWVTGAEPEPYLDPEVRWTHHLDKVGVSRLRPRVRELTEAEAASKLDVLRGYATQFASLNAVGNLTTPEVRRWEVHWEVSRNGSAGRTAMPRE